jgi:hypothetical protein
MHTRFQACVKTEIVWGNALSYMPNAKPRYFCSVECTFHEVGGDNYDRCRHPKFKEYTIYEDNGTFASTEESFKHCYEYYKNKVEGRNG